MSDFYTRGQVAAALGVSRMHAHRLLPSQSADSFSLRRAGAAAWSLDALPASIRHGLDVRAERVGCSVEQLLANPPPRRLSATALLYVRPQYFNASFALRHFLETYLLGFPDPQDAVWWTHRIDNDFFLMVDPRHQRTLIRGVVRCDKGLGRWDRLKPYLQVCTSRSRAARAWRECVVRKFLGTYYYQSIFQEVAALVEDRNSPTKEEKVALWIASFYAAYGEEKSDPMCRSADARAFNDNDAEGRIRRSVLRRVLRSNVSLMPTRREIVKYWSSLYTYWKQFGELMPMLGLGKGARFWRVP